ncbi:hypothetical protein GOB93_07790 [Acetobacter musti]|uniref:TVP38/TMEM64 family membrane protein n=1 Tax=Acetobacter musti TaxID=864732 RepID=A0ABX0JRG1_9PROT|nr:VTT domain-containing protein [Acetobacter musti]NHN84545.1 hypothetical protein [Acetobacter musti]
MTIFSGQSKNYAVASGSRNSALRAIIVLGVVAVVLGAVSFVFRHSALALLVQNYIPDARQEGGWRGWMLCELIQIVVALCGILPASATAMGIGAAYGVTDGFLLAAPATLIGALIAFVLSRTFLRGFIARLLQRSARLDRLDRVLSAEGWKIACLFRLSPIMPFSLTSFALGMSSLSAGAYMTGTLASLPALLGYVAMGALASKGITALDGDSVSWLHAGLMIAGAAGTFALVWHLNRVISRVLRSETDRP